MGFLDKIKKTFGLIGEAADNNAKKPAGITKKIVFNFSELPKTLDEFKAVPGADLKDPFTSAALAIVALAVYPTDKDASIAMLDYLNGPNEFTPFTKQFLADRFRETDYIPRSFFEGASQDNDYTPSKPYAVKVSSNPYSDENEGYKVLWMTSGGADSPRQVTLRLKPSTGEWFVTNFEMLLGGIKLAKSADPWA